MELKGEESADAVGKVGFTAQVIRLDRTIWAVFRCRMVVYWSGESASLEGIAFRQTEPT